MDETTRICSAIRHAMEKAGDGPVALDDYLEICQQIDLAKLQLMQHGRGPRHDEWKYPAPITPGELIVNPW
jgi:hypothetical protein